MSTVGGPYRWQRRGSEKPWLGRLIEGSRKCSPLRREDVVEYRRTTALFGLGLTMLMAAAVPARGQATQVPTSLQLTLAQREAYQGDRVRATVHVRNYRDET